MSRAHSVITGRPHLRAALLVSALFLTILALARCTATNTAGDQSPEDHRSPEGISLPTAGGSFRVVYTSRPGTIPLNESFSLEVAVIEAGHPDRAADDVRLAVDGRMPQHRHGMNREPRIRAVGNGRFVVDGLLFHMPGEWVLSFDVSRNGVTERAQRKIVLD